jgi:hypothetical protein
MHDWGDCFVECRPAFQRASGRRILAVAGMTFVVAGVTIAAVMAIALSRHGVI